MRGARRHAGTARLAGMAATPCNIPLRAPRITPPRQAGYSRAPARHRGPGPDLPSPHGPLHVTHVYMRGAHGWRLVSRHASAADDGHQAMADAIPHTLH